MSFDSSFFVGTRPEVKTSLNNCIREKQAARKMVPRCLKSQTEPLSRPGTACSRPRTADPNIVQGLSLGVISKTEKVRRNPSKVSGKIDKTFLNFYLNFIIMTSS